MTSLSSSPAICFAASYAIQARLCFFAVRNRHFMEICSGFGCGFRSSRTERINSMRYLAARIFSCSCCSFFSFASMSEVLDFMLVFLLFFIVSFSFTGSVLLSCHSSFSMPFVPPDGKYHTASGTSVHVLPSA